jgi:hypothetical protein
MNNPFAPVTAAAPLKVLLWGPPDSGKTMAALSFPKVALIDTEGKAAIYARQNIQFARMPAANFADVHRALDFLAADGGKTYQTLVIDSISVPYKTALAQAESASNRPLLPLERARINRQCDALYARFAVMPLHVVVIAHEATEYETRGNALVEVGTKIDAGGSIEYHFDIGVRMRPDYTGQITRETGGFIKKGQVFKKVEYAIFN